MRPFLYLIIIAAILSGCRSQNIDTARQVDYSADLRGIRQRLDSFLSSIQIERKEITDRLSNLTLENRTTVYSQPDSTGRQYPVVVSETKADKEDKVQTEVDTDLAATVQELRNEVSVLQDKVNNSLKEQEKVSELSWWDLHKWKVIVVLVVVAVGGYFIYRLKARKV